MRYAVCLIVLCCWGPYATGQPLTAPPLPWEAGARYVFAVFTPRGPQEATVWRGGNCTLTTHRFVDRADSVSYWLGPTEGTTLRTFVATDFLGADAGAGIFPNAEEVEIQELLVYPTLLSPRDRQLTESYLAIKHGLTLGRGRPVHYLAPDTERPVWNATENPGFHHRVHGLARDAAARLLRVSETEAAVAPELLTLSWPAPPDSTAYLLVGDNDLPTAPAPNAANGRTPLQRQWRVQATGVVSPTTLRFATRRFFSVVRPGTPWELRLRGDDGRTAVYAGVSDANGTLAFTGVAFPRGISYLSLALPTRALPEPMAELSVFPNPVRAGEPVQLRVVLPHRRPVDLLVYDLSGRLVLSRSLPEATHHQDLLKLPTRGQFTLHLRPRPNDATTVPQTVPISVY